MNYKVCPHYNELVQILSENQDFENVSFQLDDTQNCKECSKQKEEVCKLWVSLALVANLRPQMGITEAKLTIGNLDDELKKIAFGLIKNSAAENNDVSQ
jgi:hypothetical protein